MIPAPPCLSSRAEALDPEHKRVQVAAADTTDERVERGRARDAEFLTTDHVLQMAEEDCVY